MAAAENKTKIDVPVLTERELEIIVGAIRCMEGGLPKVSRILSSLFLQLCPELLNPPLVSLSRDAFCFARSLAASWPQEDSLAPFNLTRCVKLRRPDPTWHSIHTEADTFVTNSPTCRSSPTWSASRTPTLPLSP
ncbi:hypothetical protein KVR01_006056 [Diaporthe batatas]|uniref:uncharacterized protein n=1 Tax=Diaporthe batatas TaxID=748121 RepID=UPI001D041F7A|nr:uncharacterized protein KVR01_006056 [Diaporthe batatas]KAG8164138.1 hypothetical protein KVR01_006056 [Diaporthe batatas]